MVTLQKFKENKLLTDQISLLEERPVQPSQLQDFEKAWTLIEGTSHLSLFSWLNDLNRLGYSGKMFPVSCHQTKEGTLEVSLEHWQNAGMGSPTGFSTLSMSEHNDFQGQYPKEEGVSSLWEILQTGKIQQRYYLTKKQCQRILNRAEQKGGEIPEGLKNYLVKFIENTTEKDHTN